MIGKALGFAVGMLFGLVIVWAVIGLASVVGVGDTRPDQCSQQLEVCVAMVDSAFELYDICFDALVCTTNELATGVKCDTLPHLDRMDELRGCVDGICPGQVGT